MGTLSIENLVTAVGGGEDPVIVVGCGSRFKGLKFTKWKLSSMYFEIKNWPMLFL